MRYRSKYEVASLGQWSTQRRFYNGSWDNWDPINPLPMSFPRKTQHMQDFNNGRSRPRGSGLSHLKVEREIVGPWTSNNGVNVQYKYSPWYLSNMVVPQGGAPSPDSGFGKDLYHKALQAVLEGSALTTQAMALPMIKELRRTIQMVKRPLNFLKKFKPGRVRKGEHLISVLRRHGLDPASDAWLSYRYGWKPLFSDLAAITDTLLSVDSAYSAYQQAQAKGLKGRQIASSSTTTRSEPPSNWRYGHATLSEGRHTTRCILRWSVAPSSDVLCKANFIASKLGLGGKDLLSAGWEIIPWSFVVDWFIPVGDTLMEWSQTPAGFSVESVMYDRTVTGTTTYMYRDDGAMAYTNYGVSTYTVMRDTSHLYERGVEPFYDSGDWFTTTRAITALALINQVLRLPINHKG